MDKKFTEKIIREKNQKIKRDSNRFLRIFLIIFIAGYAVFFTSTIWMPDDYTGIKASSIGETVITDYREVTPCEWVYSKDQGMMSVVLEINNISADGKNRYEWTAVDRRKGALQIKPVFEKDDMAQLFINTNSFTEVSLRMGFDKEKEPVKLYATGKTIKNVKRVREYTEKECEVIICDAHISASKAEIRTLEKKNEKQELLIRNSKETIESLKEKEEYQTEQEISETEDKIADISFAVDSAKQKISDNEQLISELKKKMILLEKKKSELTGGDNNDRS